MKKTLILGSLALVTLGGAFAYAQQGRGPGAERPRFEMSREDRMAMLDGRLAGAKAMLRLTPEQEKLWSPVETTMRELATKRLERNEQRRAQRGPGNDRPPAPPEADPIKRMRDGAARMQEGATAMSKMAEASAPLYATLDPAQKRRFSMLLRQGMRGERMGPGRGGPEHDHGPRGEHEHRGGGRL